jgi:hypothetical protein
MAQLMQLHLLRLLHLHHQKMLGHINLRHHYFLEVDLLEEYFLLHQ